MHARIQRLKERVFAMDDRTVFLERLTLMKRGYEKHRDKSPALRYALILDEVLANISIPIDTDDLLAGRVRETVPTDRDNQALADIAEYYRTECPEAVNTRARDAFGVVAAPSWFSTAGHLTVSWETLLAKGMTGVRDLAEARREEIVPTAPNARQQTEFLDAVIVCCDAVTGLAGRYAEELDSRARQEQNDDTRLRLEATRDTLRQVPAGPATSFREALQSVWFLDLIMHQVCGARDYAPGRMDQYLYDFYARDLEQGLLTDDDAIELLQNFFIHTVEISGLSDHTHGAEFFNYTATMPVKRSLCRDSVQYLVLAGQTPDGRDASNDLSALILDAIDDIRTKSPTIIIRYHDGINRDFWLKACDVMHRSLNNIGIYNDETVIEAFVRCGVKPEDAINYSHYGCCNPAIPGKDAQIREDQRNLPKILELTLNDGFDPVSQKQRGPHTGEPDEFTTFDDLMAAFKTQMSASITGAIAGGAAFYERYVADRPFSFESCLLEGCVEMAMDCNDPARNPTEGGPGYIHYTVAAAGLATTTDSLAAIRQLVYEDKAISFGELKDALASNFEHDELLRLRLQNKCAKYGNDDDYADSIASDIGETFCDEVLHHRDEYPTLGLCWPLLYSYHRYRSCGLSTGATPDGRKAFDPVSENHSPVNGCDQKGLSALINTLGKLGEAFRSTPGGGLTINVHPTALMVEDGAGVLADVLETYFEKGGLYVQPNIIDRDTLIEAQLHPEKHRDLLVRVTGYSAYFVTLSPESQDNIIARFAHTS